MTWRCKDFGLRVGLRRGGPISGGVLKLCVPLPFAHPLSSLASRGL